MFEIITEYNKEIFCKCYKVYYKIFIKYNVKGTILLTIMCFVLATISLILGITKPETFHTTFATVFFYIMASVFLVGMIIMREIKSDKGIKRTVNRIFEKSPNMNLVAKYVFDDEKFYSSHGENDTTNYEYIDIVHFEVVDDQIIVLLKNKKFIALNTNEDKVIEFLKSKILK